jgi:hypothetical protein
MSLSSLAFLIHHLSENTWRTFIGKSDAESRACQTLCRTVQTSRVAAEYHARGGPFSATRLRNTLPQHRFSPAHALLPHLYSLFIARAIEGHIG